MPRKNDEWFVVSPQFFAWIFGLGTGVKVVGPDDVVKEEKEYAKAFLSNMNLN